MVLFIQLEGLQASREAKHTLLDKKLHLYIGAGVGKASRTNNKDQSVNDQ